MTSTISNEKEATKPPTTVIIDDPDEFFDLLENDNAFMTHQQLIGILDKAGKTVREDVFFCYFIGKLDGLTHEKSCTYTQKYQSLVLDENGCLIGTKTPLAHITKLTIDDLEIMLAGMNEDQICHNYIDGLRFGREIILNLGGTNKCLAA